MGTVARAVVKAAWGRTSRMRTLLLLNMIWLREEGRTGVNGGEGAKDIFDME